MKYNVKIFIVNIHIVNETTLGKLHFSVFYVLSPQKVLCCSDNILLQGHDMDLLGKISALVESLAG